MTLLHDYLHTRNQQGFVRLLDSSSSSSTGNGVSSSAGKSWGRGLSGLTIDVNARDWLGRTALHLACTSVENVEFVRALLKHPNVNVNLADTESHWTALHRALYHANFPAALLLLQRSDTDTTLKDLEGYTAFDLYNSTVDHSKPDRSTPQTQSSLRGELFTWGANRNAALGLGDGDDRGHPEQVILQPQDSVSSSSNIDRFAPVYVNQVHMSKLHTALVTEEPKGNVRVCGFGSGGRLGSTQHTLYTPTALPTLQSAKIISLALGQDHTLALTSAGEVLSWGLNRFGQLGYTIESTGGFKDNSMQLTPKRVYGPLKKEIVKGVAAAKTASACWTSEVVYTWGTNGGQLGYDKSTNPTQPLPRIVSLITKPVLQLALSSTVLAALLITHQVECIFSDRHIRVNFPAHIFPSEIQPYRPPQASKDSDIRKIVVCQGDGEVFAALSGNGEVFIFGAPSSSEPGGQQGGGGQGQGQMQQEKKITSLFKPQRVWALRKKFSAVRDVALGAEGSIIVCTESGHVFTRSRTSKGQGQGVGKFHRVQGLQRVVGVCANSTGAFGALRVDWKIPGVEMVGRRMCEDLRGVEPFMVVWRKPQEDVRMQLPAEEEVPENLEFATEEEGEEEKDEYDLGILRDVEGVKEICDALKWEKELRKASGGSVSLDEGRLPHGTDALVLVHSVVIPVHKVLLAARCAALYNVLSVQGEVKDVKSGVGIRLVSMKLPVGKTVSRISVSGCHPLTVLILLRYLYSDELLAIWDSRVGGAVQRELGALKVGAGQVKSELQALSRALALPKLAAALEPPTKRIPTPSLEGDMSTLFDASQSFEMSPSSLRDPLAPDVILQLADRDVYTHSTILRSRSEFFGSFFGEEAWTLKRRDAYGMVRMDMKHLEWRVMRFVLRFVCCGEDEGMFDCLDFTQSVDDVLEFMFDVMAAANELLLDRLVLLCSSIILKFTNLYNACSILAEATYFNAEQLIERVQSYITVNMEAFLDTRMLNSIPPTLAKQLSLFVKGKQQEKSPVSRSGKLAMAAVEKHREWLALQDIPVPVVTRASLRREREREREGKLSPPIGMARRASRPSFSGVANVTPPESPVTVQAQVRRAPAGDDIFEMDSDEPAPPPQASPAVWKPASRPRVDMKTVMADQAASGQKSQRETPFGTPNASSSNLVIPTHTVARKSSWNDVPRTPPAARAGAPWKTPAEAAAGRHSPPGTPGTSIVPNVMATPPRPPVSKSNLSATKPPPATTPGLGPVITPTRQPSSKPSASVTPRHVSGGKAWTLPPVQPVIATSPPTAGMSFVAIQHSQLEQVIDPTKDKRSLREIQEEEQARQAEEDFMKWWHEEEERVRMEAEALAQFQAAASGSGAGRGRGGERGRPKGKPGRGRGGKKTTDKDKDKPQDNTTNSDGRKGDKQQYHNAEGSGKLPGGSRDGANANATGQPRHRPRRPAKDKAAV